MAGALIRRQLLSSIGQWNAVGIRSNARSIYEDVYRFKGWRNVVWGS
jgi:hypothetical protein